MDAIAVARWAALFALCVGCAPEAGRAKGPPEGPFAVSDYFAASGAMGDGATPPRLAINENNAACKKPRPPGARGNCFSFVYDPRLMTSVTPPVEPVFWAGLYWQYPANNWGDERGLPVPAGISKVTFQAAVAGASEMAEFAAGGVGYPASSDPTLPDRPYEDSFRAPGGGPLRVGLNEQWTKLEIALDAAPSELIGAFTFSLSYPDGDLPTTTPKTLYIDDLFYE